MLSVIQYHSNTAMCVAQFWTPVMSVVTSEIGQNQYKEREIVESSLQFVVLELRKFTYIRGTLRLEDCVCV